MIVEPEQVTNLATEWGETTGYWVGDSSRFRWFTIYLDAIPTSLGILCWRNESTASLYAAYVKPKYRHRGLYRELLVERIDYARFNGAKRLVCEVQNEKHGDLLEQYGFVVDSGTPPSATLELGC